MQKITQKPLLLIIDVQNAYDQNQPWECPNITQAVENIKLIAKSKITDNIYATAYIAPTHPQGVWKDYNEKYSDINKDPYANEIISSVKALCPSDHIYTKSTYSAMKIADMAEVAMNAPYVIVTGVTTGCCVLSTVMDLIDMGIYVYLVKDATAGSSIECEQAVWTTLKGLSPLHLTMLNSRELISQVLQSPS